MPLDLKSFLASVAERVKLGVLVVLIGMSMSNSAMGADVVKDTIKFNSDKDLVVHGYKWSSTSVQPKVVVVAIHGGVQHAGVYAALAERLVPQGVITYSVDLRGHGEWLVQSKKTPKVNYNASTQDVVRLTKALRSEYPGLPIFCMGESLGAATALHAVSHSPNLFDGLILASPGTSPNMSHAWGAVLGSIGNGAKSLGTSIDISSHVKRISEDPRSCDEMINDVRNRNKASLPDLIHSAHFVRENRSLVRRLDKKVPVLFLQGSVDQICSNKSMDSLFERIPAEDKTMKNFPGVGHLLLTTVYLKPEVVTVVSDWIAKHGASQNQPIAKADKPE